jgi:RHH-type transcriptional regulator, rel operon repressor / antitoxin RelB
MLAVRLDEDLLRQIDGLAHNKRTTRSALVKEAIIRFLEDQDDLELAEAAKQKMTSKKPLKKLREDLGLDS